MHCPNQSRALWPNGFETNNKCISTVQNINEQDGRTECILNIPYYITGTE